MRLLVLATVLIVSLGLGGCFSTGEQSDLWSEKDRNVDDPFVARDNTYDGARADKILAMDWPEGMRPLPPRRHRLINYRRPEQKEFSEWLHSQLDLTDKAKGQENLTKFARYLEQGHNVQAFQNYVRYRIMDDQNTQAVLSIHNFLLMRYANDMRFKKDMIVYGILIDLIDKIDLAKCADRPLGIEKKKFPRTHSQSIRIFRECWEGCSCLNQHGRFSSQWTEMPSTRSPKKSYALRK